MSSEVSGNLPPKVVGLLRGFLVVSFKTLSWIERRFYSPSTVIRLSWWGEELEASVLLGSRSKDVRQQRATYAIRCSLRNFEAYTADVGVLTVYVLSKKGEIIGWAAVDRLPSLAHPVINSLIPVVVDNGQKIASISIVFKLEETDRRASTSCLTKSNDVRDTIAGLLIKSRELQKAINIILKGKNAVPLIKNSENLQSVYLNVDRPPMDCISDENSVMDEMNAFIMQDYPELLLSSEGSPSNEHSKYDVFKGAATVSQYLANKESKQSFRVVPSCFNSKSNKGVLHRAEEKIKRSDVNVNPKSSAGIKLDASTNVPDVINVCHTKKCSVSNKKGPLMYCLLSIPKGCGLFRSLHPIPDRLYLVVRILWLNGIFCSDVSSNGNFAFHQVTSVQITQHLLNQFRSNFVSVEVWKKTTLESDQIVGISKLPLHAFYLAYRDDVATDSLSATSEAIIAVDEFLPIEDLFCGKIVGQLQVFFAMGTEQQIKQLRGCSVSSPVANVSSMETIEHFFEITINHLKLHRPPLSNIWGECDCFVQYMFPAQDKLRPNCSLHLVKYVIGPYLCQERIQFKTMLKHNFLSRENSLQNYLREAFTTQKLSFQVWCRYYNPEEEDRLIAEANIPLSSLFNMISANDHMEVFHLNLEPVNTNTHNLRSHKSKNLGFMAICISYSKLIKYLDYITKCIVKKTCDQPAVVQMDKEFTRIETEDNLGTQHFSDEIKDSFSVLVNIERAAHLSNCQVKSSIDRLPPNCYVTVSCASSSEDVLKTPVICASTNPCWNFEGKMTLPVDLLFQHHKNLIFHIWHVEDESFSTNGRRLDQNKSGLLLGLVSVDLSPLLYGMHQLSGWYNIDFEGRCNGQIKVTINPQCDMETAKAAIPKQPVVKEVELVEDLKVDPAFHQQLDASRSLLVDNLRNKLTHLESIESFMEQMSKHISPSNDHLEYPEDLSRNIFQTNGRTLPRRDVENDKLICNSQKSRDQPADATNASHSTSPSIQNSILRYGNNSSLSSVDKEELRLNEDSLAKTRKNDVRNIRSTRVGSRVAAAIFHSD